MKEKIFKILHNRDRMPGERFGDIEGKIEEFFNQEVEKRIAERMSDDVIEAVVLSWAPVCHIGETGEDLNANVREEIIELIQELRSRLVSRKTEGGGE